MSIAREQRENGDAVLVMFVVTWIAYVKLQRFYKLERERCHKAYKRRAADFRKLCEV